MTALATEWPGIRSCSESATIRLIDYLANTHVRGYAIELAHGRLLAWRVTLPSRERLGSTLSIFRELGGIAAHAVTGRPRFLISEVAAVLHRPDCADCPSRKSLEWLIERRGDGMFRDWQIVMLHSTLGAMVVDGNKRAAAIHETSAADVTVPAFILSRPSGEKVEPPP